MKPIVESQQSRVLIQLRDLILKGAFAPGERLAEIPLAERLEASRTPVRLALTTLEYEGLIEALSSGGYRMRGFTNAEVAHAIQTRGVLEGYAARLLAESGPTRQLLRQLHECLDEADEAVNKPQMSFDDYAAYVEINARFHGLILEGSGNRTLQRMMEMLNGQPFAAPSAMLPMQSSHEEGTRAMQQAQLQHHALVQAIERGQGTRAQALGEEHITIALSNVEYATKNPELAAEIMPGIRLVTQAV
ncbi:MAG TPA: GntR family transcriptional regulator [Pusillimonas sp.]|uniref:GntR family transcriptional regulator n=1 Tax=Pusillimonas sp. TaxID=3040095 RepID=UPI002D10BCB7|nr:GntR family transcriptional regulator [Pusillimonas sp.]HUH87477.1 GntR family transcriptional regulator [Pusillimonas sp.]